MDEEDPFEKEKGKSGHGGIHHQRLEQKTICNKTKHNINDYMGQSQKQGTSKQNAKTRRDKLKMKPKYIIC